jgi:hypothetical protein
MCSWALVDFRVGHDGLAAPVQRHLKKMPFGRCLQVEDLAELLYLDKATLLPLIILDVSDVAIDPNDLVRHT